MLKQVEFVGFESDPRLRPYFERLMPDLELEIGRWAKQVHVSLELKKPRDSNPVLGLTLSIERPVSGSNTGIALLKEIEHPDRFRYWVRGVWDRLLSDVLNQRAEKWEKEMESDLMTAQGS